ncbi:patatin-like phospholipase family protein [Sandarakinorhabdus sp. DWP1-3-1]|uniref:patatin-like phospholipase family protein n=1 Tax=Sandarakinorhabdus sp. DWP1-3-1 TaxID=2804627 RepID=UPI003CEB20F3
MAILQWGWRTLLVVAAMLASGAVQADQPGPPPDPGATRPAPPVFAATNRPRIGLVLGGGGAKGFAHIGVIAELERRRIPIDVIAGTSMGAVVGSMYAIGNDAAQIRAIADGIDWVTVFNDSPSRNDLSFRRKREVRDLLLNYRLGLEDGKPVLPRGALGGQRLFATVQELLAPWRATEDFNNLPIPFRAVATDIVTGKHVVMDSGNLSTAVFASMSIPAGFPPVKREGLLLVDGSISDNLPIDVARRMGVDVVIAVDVGDPPKSSADKINSALDVFTQMQLLLGYDAIKRQRDSMAGRDVLIDPDITGLSVTAFNQSDLAIERGRAAAASLGDRLAALSVGEAEWAAYLAARRARANPAPIRIDRVEVATNSKVPVDEIRALVQARPGDMLDGARMRDDVGAIFKLDEFDRVDYRIDIADGRNTLVVNAEGARGTRRYFQTGLILASNFGKSATFDLGLGYTDRDFLGTGAEWRGFARVGNDVLFETSLYRQFGNVFVEPIANYQRYSSLVIQQGSQQTLASLQVSRLGVGVDGGLLFGNWGELRAGVRFGGLNPGDEANSFGIDPGWNRDVDWRVGFTVDTLDSLTFPRSGLFAQVQVIDHVTAFGGAFARDNISLTVQKPISWDRATLVLGGRLATTSRARGDFIGDFQLGGFLNLSGLQRNSLIGPQLLFGRAVGYYRLSQRAPILDLPVYLGGSLEVGNVWTSRDDISLGSLRTAASLFVAADTPIGPAWLAYGLSEGNGSIYLVLGRIF